MVNDILTGLYHTVGGWNSLAIVAGAAWGIFGGALPGITGAICVALILPFTFGMPPTTALVLLCSCYSGSMFGGSISAILLGAPGTASAAATLLDGREMYKKGQGGLAVGTALAASTIGGIIGSLVLILFCTPLAKVALLFGPPEYFALGLFGLTVISSLSPDMVKGFMAGIAGMMVATIGIDQFVGQERFTFGLFELVNGIEFLPVLIGVFAMSEMMMQIVDTRTDTVTSVEQKAVSAKLPSFAMLCKLKGSILLGAAIGTIIGIMPGAGGSIGSWVAYSQARRISKYPEEFGKGSMEGVAAPEAANSSSEGGALIPMLALGIPGSNTTAIMLGALTLQGLTPGPMLFSERPEVVYSVYGSTFLANFAVLILGMISIKPLLRLASVKPRYSVACIFVLICAAAYSIQTSIFDVWLAIIFGVVGVFMKRYGFSAAAFVLGMILGPILESALQRSFMLSHGSPLIFFTRPVSLGILALTFISFSWPWVSAFLYMRNIKKSDTGPRA